MADRELTALLSRHYPLRTVVEPTGGWFIWFPDLPGCMSYAASIDEIGPQARLSFEIWMRAEYEAGHPIPEPTIDGEGPGWTAEDRHVDPATIVRNGAGPSAPDKRGAVLAGSGKRQNRDAALD